MTAVKTGIQYIGGPTATNELINNKTGTINRTQKVEKGVLANHITIPVTITGKRG